MKKILFLSLCVGAMFCSCSNDEKVDGPRNGNEIAFTTFVNKNTRADNPTTTANLDAINVSAFSIGAGNNTANTGVLLLDNTRVTRSGAAGSYAWTYSPVVYWTANTHYTFAAVNEGTIKGLSDGIMGNFDFTNTDGTKDIVWATNYRTTPSVLSATPPAVPFNFRHALCRVKFTLTFDDPNHRYAVGIKNIKLKGTSESGTYDLGESDQVPVVDGNWRNLAGSFTAVYDDGNNEAISRFDEVSGAFVPVVSEYRYLIPGDYTDAAKQLQPAMDITLYISSIDGTRLVYQQTFSYVLDTDLMKKIAANFVQGHSYNITATLRARSDGSGDDTTINPEGDLYPIEFTVEDVTDFTDDENLPW